MMCVLHQNIRRFMKKILLNSFAAVMLFITLSAAWYVSKYNPETKSKSASAHTATGKDVAKRLALFSGLLQQYAIENRYNRETCFLADMGLPSGSKRFFIYNMPKDSVVNEGLVAHGSCDAGFRVRASFSNKSGSGCSSYGKYKIGKSYYGQYGLAYKLHGLDSSNSNAFERNIVLHSYNCVPEQETHPWPICNSRGCPMTSPGFLNKLRAVIDGSKKPVLLWIYE